MEKYFVPFKGTEKAVHSLNLHKNTQNNKSFNESFPAKKKKKVSRQ